MGKRLYVTWCMVPSGRRFSVMARNQCPDCSRSAIASFMAEFQSWICER